MLVPFITIENVSGYIEADPIPTDPYPYFGDGVHQWLFENNLDDTGSSVVDYDLSGVVIYNDSIPLIRTGGSCAWFDGTNVVDHSTAFDMWRTNYSDGWGLSLWFYVTSSQSWKIMLVKYNDNSPENYLQIQPNRVTLEVDNVNNYIGVSYSQNIWNNVIVTQASNGSAWVWVNGIFYAFWNNYGGVLNDAEGTIEDFTIGGKPWGGSYSNNFTGAIDDVRFYDFTLNQTYADYLWTACNIPSSGDWLLDADTELYNEENITITDGSIIIGSYSPTREVNFTMYNTNLYFNSSENDEGIYGDNIQTNFINFTKVGIFNATDKWIILDFYYFIELHLTDFYMQHGGNNIVGSKPMVRVNPYMTNNPPIRINNFTLYDVNGTGLSFQGSNVATNIIIDDVNITRFINSGISLGNSLASAPKGGTWNDIYIYTDIPNSQHNINTYSQNDVWTNLDLRGSGVLLAPHKLFQWQGDHNVIRDSFFRDCDNGIWLSGEDDDVLYAYNVTIENCADGVDSGSGILFLYDSILDRTRDRVFSMEETENIYVINCQITNTLPGQHDIYYRAGNITFVNTFFSQPYSSPVGDYTRNIFQHWNFSTSDVYVNCTTVDDESNLNVAIQSTTWVIESEVPKLTIEVDAPSGTSEIIVYCGENGEPSSIYVKGVEIDSWSYDSITQLATITVTHSSEETIIVFWSELATMGSIVGGTFILLLIGITLIGVLLMRRRR